MRRPGTQRLVAWVAMAAAGIIALALASRSGQHAAAARSMGYALLAAVGASLLLHRLGRRLVGVLGLALSVGLALLVVMGAGHPGLWAAAALGAAGSAAQLLLAGRWSTATSRYRRTAPERPRTDLDVWKALDAGMDPTSDDFGDNLTSRETSPDAARTTGATARSAHQEDE